MVKRKHSSYGGFQPLELKKGQAYYSEDAFNLLKFNSAKVGIDMLIEKNHIKKMFVPFYLCPNVCREIEKHDVQIEYYSIDCNLLPILERVEAGDWIYIVDYFGVMDKKVDSYISEHPDNQYIVDNCHSFYHKPHVGDNYIYSCRKFFGVPDGAYLITNSYIASQPQLVCNAKQAGYLLTCLEEGTNVCYQEKKKMDQYIAERYEGMSLLTDAIMKSIDYEEVKQRRQKNAQIYEEKFGKLNCISIESESIPYVYPLNIGKNIKNELVKNKIFVPTLWEQCGDEKYKDTWEYKLTKNTIFLPVDQRYDEEDIHYIISVVESLI